MSTQSRIELARLPNASTESPLRLADATFRAVNQLGALTATEIDKTADEIMHSATEIAERLDELAHAIRYHSQVASENVADFCAKATSVYEGAMDLQSSLLPIRRARQNGRD
jgi:hypothetical protein